MKAPAIREFEPRDRIDIFGGLMLTAVYANLALNQALIKLVNAGMAPVFQAGMRSLFAILPIALYMWWRGKEIRFAGPALLPGLACGILFAAEFALMFAALDFTTVGRSSVFFYTMPFWVAVAAHFLIPGETMTRQKAIGLILAIIGVALALMSRGPAAGPQAYIGDLMALAAATGWASITILLRTTAMSKISAEMQLLYQLVFSAPILLALALSQDETFRQMTPGLWAVFGYQVLGVVALGFTLWFWLLAVYPASRMASFAFLTPLFGVVFGWLIFDEALTANLLGALVLVGAGIWLVNRR